ncbi:sperm acrosome associated 6 [Solea solea]|uniref:sperm acrosome associated 6 n=1 Tax=Solea solea TaxID=90069 RepID=UPI00272D2E38|nr:sperm acrosome associated 6 [Solea solea]
MQLQMNSCIVKSALWLVCISLLFSSSQSCYQCFFEARDRVRLCFEHTRSHMVIDTCMRMLNRIFNNNNSVIEAGRVGRGYDKQLNDILHAEIRPLEAEFGLMENVVPAMYEGRLQTAADNFIAAASRLPRASGCVPPCGFQSAGAVYNCDTCRYVSCELPLDCPVRRINVTENNRSRMWCDVQFRLPDNIKIMWRFAEEVETQQMNQFEVVTVGVDKLYSISSASPQHQGTYMCEIFSDQRSIVRLYFYLFITSHHTRGYEKLQDIFDLSLLPGGRLLGSTAADDPPHVFLPPLLLLIACLTSLLLLLFLTLGALYWSLPEKTNLSKKDGDDLDS